MLKFRIRYQNVQNPSFKHSRCSNFHGSGMHFHASYPYSDNMKSLNDMPKKKKRLTLTFGKETSMISEMNGYWNLSFQAELSSNFLLNCLLSFSRRFRHVITSIISVNNFIFKPMILFGIWKLVYDDTRNRRSQELFW